MRQFLLIIIISISLIGCATVSNPIKENSDKLEALYSSGKITTAQYERGRKVIKFYEAQQREQQKTEALTILAAMCGATGQASQPSYPPQYQGPQIIQPSSGTYRVQHVGGNSYRVDEQGYTVLPAPKNNQ